MTVLNNWLVPCRGPLSPAFLQNLPTDLPVLLSLPFALEITARL